MRYALFLLVIIFSFLQETEAQSIAEKYLEYKQKPVAEKIYIHFDKSIYHYSDDIWFKVYMLDGLTNLPVELSNVVNVELIDVSNNILMTKIVKIEDGNGKGDFKLSKDIVGGSYKVRAYTNNMRNWGNEFFFQKDILVINGNAEVMDQQLIPESLTKNENSDDTTSIVSDKPFYLDFLPEGGDMIEGITNQIGFKAVGLAGRGVDVKGDVIDENGDIVSSFESFKFGMGSFFFRPQPEKKYKAIAYANDQKWTFDFPEAKPKGYVMRIDFLRGDKMNILLKSNIQEGLKECRLIAQIHGELIVEMDEIKSINDEAVVVIPTEELRSGILQVTLFDKNKRPQCERIVLINNSNAGEDISMATDKLEYGIRDSVNLTVDMNELVGSSLLLNSSLSVTNFGIIDGGKGYANNIVNNLLLTSDLKGYIENPGYYFDQSIDEFERRRALNNVMITHGWRRFSWGEVLFEENKEHNFGIEQGFSISGQVVTSDNKETPVTSGYASLNLTSVNGLVFDEVLTDENGRFLFAGLDIPDSASVVLTAGINKTKNKNTEDTKRQKKVRIILDENGKPEIELQKATKIFRTTLSQNDTNYYIQLDKTSAAYDEQQTILLEGVTIEDRIYHENDPFLDATKIYGKPTRRVVLDSIPGSQSALDIGQILRGRVPGLTVLGQPPEQQIVMRGMSSFSNNAPLFLFNGIPVDAEFIFDVIPSDIAYIDILTGAKATAYGSRGSNGVIALYTRQGKKGHKINDEVYLDRGVLNYTYYGYSTAREFYSPQYDEKLEFVKPDYRTTLYWNPNLEFDEEGKTQIKFYSNDSKNSKFRVELEGVKNNGQPVRVEKYFFTGKER